MDKLSLSLDGMGCGGCVKNVRKALDALPGVAVEDVKVGSAALAFDPTRSSPEVIKEALAKAGYPARETGAATASTGPAREGGHCGV